MNFPDIRPFGYDTPELALAHFAYTLNEHTDISANTRERLYLYAAHFGVGTLRAPDGYITVFHMPTCSEISCTNPEHQVVTFEES